MTYAVLTVRLALAGVLLLSAVAKARSFEDTRAMVEQLLRRVRPSARRSARRLARPCAVLLVSAECATGLALLGAGRTVLPGLLAAVVLTAGFTVLALLATVFRTEVACACFGRPTARLGRRHVVRNGFLLALACLGLWGSGTSGAHTPAPAGIAVCATAAVVITAVTAFYDDIVDLIKEEWA